MAEHSHLGMLLGRPVSLRLVTNEILDGTLVEVGDTDLVVSTNPGEVDRPYMQRSIDRSLRSARERRSTGLRSLSPHEFVIPLSALVWARERLQDSAKGKV